MVKQDEFNLEGIPVEIQRAVLEQRLQNMQAGVMQSFIDLESLKSQRVPEAGQKQLDEQIAAARLRYENGLRAMRRTKELLDALPKREEQVDGEAVNEARSA